MILSKKDITQFVGFIYGFLFGHDKPCCEYTIGGYSDWRKLPSQFSNANVDMFSSDGNVKYDVNEYGKEWSEAVSYGHSFSLDKNKDECVLHAIRNYYSGLYLYTDDMEIHKKLEYIVRKFVDSFLSYNDIKYTCCFKEFSVGTLKMLRL